jgi:hypothetical protein
VTKCARDDCSRETGRNGIGCHQHFTTLVPAFLSRAFFARSDEFTKQWIARNVRAVIRGEQFVA